MKAIVYTQYGSPDVLHLKEVDKPIPKEKEVLVKVHASTVNRTDCGFLRAEPFIVRFFSGLTKPKNTILGNEFAGEIEEIGSGVTSFKIGDNVFGMSGEIFGAHAEYIAVHEDGPISLMPKNFTYEEAAPGTEGIHYAWNDIRAARVQRGQDVLIHGATGAIGTAAVQLVKYLGAHVTAVCNTKNVELVRSLGADVVIDYMKEDFTKVDRLYDFIFDAVGKSSFRVCKPLLKPSGIFCSTDFGPFPWNPLLALWTPFFGGKKVIFPLPKNTKKDVTFFKELMEAGKLKPVIDRRYPLEQVAEAFRYVETEQKTGNVVIIVKS
ncbi:MAG: NAD(P)-dependent alcohol dehydrogenase [Ignavibacteriales bacterium]|nr:NAD(P)-dependent alcohol dehydrogenase [Ignavibacteriales bacterium]